MKFEPANPKKRKSAWRRWLGRGGYFTGWVLGFALALVLLLIAVLWVAYKNPTAMAKLGIDLFAPTLGLEIDEVDVSAPGEVVLRGIALNGDGDTVPLRVDLVEIGYSGLGWDVIEIGQIDSVLIKGGLLTADDAFLEKWLPEGEAEDVDAGPTAMPAWLGQVVPREIGIEEFGFVLNVEGLPPLTGDIELLSDGGASSMLDLGIDIPMRHHLLLRRGRVGAGEGVASFDKLDASIELDDATGEIVVSKVELSGLQGRMSPQVLEMLEGFSGEPEADAAAMELPTIVVREATIGGASLSFSGFEGLPEISAEVGVGLEAIRFADGELSSAAEQSVVVRELLVDASGAEKVPILRWDELELVAIPDLLLAEGWVERLHLDGMRVDVSKRSLGELLGIASGGGTPEGEGGGEAEAAGDFVLPVIKVRNLKVEPAALSFDPEGLMAGLPAATATLKVGSEDGAAEGDAAYLLAISEVKVRETVGSDVPFARGGKGLVRFSSVGLQSEGRLDEVSLSGFRAEIGEDVQALLAAYTEGVDGEDLPEIDDPEAPPSPAAGTQSLTVAKLSIKDTIITLHDMIPGALPYLPLSIDTSLENVPVLGAASEDDELEQRVELKGVQIASPYNSLQNAADLKTVWIYFTFPGLFRSEIRRVEIVSPDIYVGEPLFWYVDYARKYAAGELIEGEPVAAGEVGEPGEAGESGGDDEVADAIVEGLKSFELSGWTIGRLEAHAGRIIIAPTGVPLGIVPFPFEAETDFGEGEIKLNVEVPTGDYVFEKLELELKKLAGKAFINYPVAGKNNNFVQTFKSPEVRFMQFEGTDLWLSVTYDQNGIYGKLGGEAYGGYVNGEFNIYIEGPYKWDAWISGEGFDLGAFTKVLAPENFLMSGVIDGRFVAEGQGIGVSKASGSAKARDGGTMHVLKLDDLKAALPEDWEPLWKAIAEVGIDALRNYPFETGSAELDYELVSGNAHILMDGEQGKRELDLKLFDKRQPSVPEP